MERSVSNHNDLTSRRENLRIFDSAEVEGREASAVDDYCRFLARMMEVCGTGDVLNHGSPEDDAELHAL